MKSQTVARFMLGKEQEVTVASGFELTTYGKRIFTAIKRAETPEHFYLIDQENHIQRKVKGSREINLL